jgi:hypothetical protein
LGYSDDEAGRRVRVARLANRFPLVIDELRAGTMHLTGLFLLEPHLTEENWEPLFAEARGKSKSEITVLIADWFPKPDVPDRLCELPDPALTGPACPGNPETGPVPPQIGRVEPLSESPPVGDHETRRFSVQFMDTRRPGASNCRSAYPCGAGRKLQANRQAPIPRLAESGLVEVGGRPSQQLFIGAGGLDPC